MPFDVETALLWFVVAVFIAIGTVLIMNVIRFGGIRGALFGATIERTIGEVTLAEGAFGSARLRISVLRAATERKIGLELVSKNFASYRLQPFTLTAAEATALRDLLDRATAQSSAASATTPHSW